MKAAVSHPAALALARRHTIGDLLSKSAARFPERTAIGWRGFRETYAELNETVNRTANSLDERGVAKVDRIALPTWIKEWPSRPHQQACLAV